MMRYVWKEPQQVNQQQAENLAKQVGVPVYIARLLIQRGVKTANDAKAFLHPSLKTLANDINLPAEDNILDIDKTCQIIKRAIRKGWKIQLYDDYDVDGITSASIMYLLIKHYLHYSKVSYYIPDRFKDGYGPNLDAYKRLCKHGMKLLITTDNGITGKAQIDWLKAHGVHVVITDHHDWPLHADGSVDVSAVPNADAICMANCPTHKFHFDDFCGAGIAFMIACHILGRVPKSMLDLACLGTVADSVSLTQENRAIVKYGIREIRHDARPGVRALAGEADTELNSLTATDLSFTLIPRLNAIGRMSNANPAVELLTTNDSKRALEIAQMIEEFNNERQKVMRKQSQEALTQASSPDNKKRTTLVLHDDNWFPGVVGIIASQVLEQYYKPTIVIGHLKSDGKDLDRGSGRSIPEFNLFKAMEPLRKDMTSFGGHPMACGLSIKQDKIKVLSGGLECMGQKAKLADVRPSIQPDINLPAIDVTWKTLKELRIMAPFGAGNPSPEVEIRLPNIYNVRTMGKTNQHLSFTLGPSYKSPKAVAFGLGDKASVLENSPFDVEIVGHLNVNRYKGRSYLQVMVSHLRYYTPKPSKRVFGIVYRYLRKHARLQFSAYNKGLIQPLAEYLRIAPRQLAKILTVFAELHLIKISVNALVVYPNPKACSLTESQTYKKWR